MSPRKRKKMPRRFYLFCVFFFKFISSVSQTPIKMYLYKATHLCPIHSWFFTLRTPRQQQEQQRQHHERKEREREKRAHKTERNELLPRRGREATATRRRKRRENYNNLRATTFPSRTSPTPIVINGTSRPRRRPETSVHATSDWCSRERSGTNLPRSRKSRADANELL